MLKRLSSRHSGLALGFRALIITAGLSLIGPMFFGNSALASPASNITVTPFSQTLTMSPTDQQKTFSINITNGSARQQTYSLSVLNFGSLDETGGVVFEGGSTNALLNKYGLASWIQMSADHLTLDAGQSADVEGTIKNDASLKPGGHYGAVMVSTGSLGSSSQLDIRQKAASLVFVTKIGSEKYDLHLDKFSSNKTLFKLPTKVAVRFANTGNTQLVPRGIVYLKDGTKVLARGVINEQSGYLLPETHRVFDLPLLTTAHQSNFSFKVYKLQVDYRYDGFENFASKSQDFVVINPVIVVSLAILTVVMVASYTVGRRMLARPSSKQKVKTTRKK